MLDVSIKNMRVRLNIFKASAQHVFEDESECFFVDVIDEMDTLLAILSNAPWEPIFPMGI